MLLHQEFIEDSHTIFEDLFNLAIEELGSNGMKIEPSLIFNKVISPIRMLYLKNLGEVIASVLEK